MEETKYWKAYFDREFSSNHGLYAEFEMTTNVIGFIDVVWFPSGSLEFKFKDGHTWNCISKETLLSELIKYMSVEYSSCSYHVTTRPSHTHVSYLYIIVVSVVQSPK